MTSARHDRLDVSPESIRSASQQPDARLEDVVRHMARQAGLSVKFAGFDRRSLSRWRAPLIVQLRDGQVGVVESVGADGELGIVLSGDPGLPSPLDPAQIRRAAWRGSV